MGATTSRNDFSLEIFVRPNSSDVRAFHCVTAGTLARAYHFSGKISVAKNIFIEFLMVSDNSDLSHYVWQYWYSTLLLDELQGHFLQDKVIYLFNVLEKWNSRMSKEKSEGKRFYSLDYELFFLVRGQLHLIIAENSTVHHEKKANLLRAKADLVESLAKAQKCSQRPHVAGSYLAMARYFIAVCSWTEADEMLKKVESIAYVRRANAVSILDDMPNAHNEGAYWSWIADLFLLRTEIAIKTNDCNSNKYIKNVKLLIEKLGYGRRKADIARLECLTTVHDKSTFIFMPQLELQNEYTQTLNIADLSMPLADRARELDRQPTVVILLDKGDMEIGALLVKQFFKSSIPFRQLGFGRMQIPKNSLGFINSIGDLSTRYKVITSQD